MTRAAATAGTLLLLALLPAHASAQATPEEAVRNAVNVLNTQDFHFSYSIWPSLDADVPTVGEGELQQAGQSFRYTVAAADGRDLPGSGEWIVSDGSFWFNDGSGWKNEGMDLNYSAVMSALVPFESYEFIAMLAEDDQLEALALVGQEDPQGLPAEHYRFTLNGVGIFPDGSYDMWLSGPPGNPERVTVRLPAASGQASTITYENIGQPVTVNVPD